MTVFHVAKNTNYTVMSNHHLRNRELSLKAKGLLKEVSLFDIYRGKGVTEGKKSVAFNLVLRADDRSLTSEEADEDVKSILEALEKHCGARLR